MYRRESECETVFRKLNQVYNANTPENHPLVFKTESEYKDAMSIFAVCARVYSDVHVYAFQLMSNHMHMVVGGDSARIMDLFAFFVSRISAYFNGNMDFRCFTLKLFPIQDLTYMRNAIVYVNRNGSVVNNDVTPFSYPWGSSRYFFQPVSASYDEVVGKPIGVANLRKLMHSRKCDEMKDLRMVDGYISPLEFCDIGIAEKVFRDAKQYFYNISRNVETYSEIAKSIGESVFYNDSDLYTAAVKLSKEHYGMFDLRTLNVEAKIEMAKRLHYDYNASDKQLHRLLNLDGSIIKALF